MQRDASLTIETERAAAGGNGRGVLARSRAWVDRLAPCPLDHDVSTHLRLIDGEPGQTHAYSLSSAVPSCSGTRGICLCHFVVHLFVDGRCSVEKDGIRLLLFLG